MITGFLTQRMLAKVSELRGSSAIQGHWHCDFSPIWLITTLFSVNVSGGDHYVCPKKKKKKNRLSVDIVISTFKDILLYPCRLSGIIVSREDIPSDLKINL